MINWKSKLIPGNAVTGILSIITGICNTSHLFIQIVCRADCIKFIRPILPLEVIRLGN